MTCQLFCTSPSSWLFNVDELAKSFLKGAIKLFGTGAKGTFWVWALTSFVGGWQVKSIFQCFFWDPCHGGDLSPIWNVSAPFWSFQTWKGLWAGAETGQTTSLLSDSSPGLSYQWRIMGCAVCNKRVLAHARLRFDKLCFTIGWRLNNGISSLHSGTGF